MKTKLAAATAPKKSKRPPTSYEFSRYLRGRIRTKAELEGMSTDQVIAAALSSYLAGGIR